MKKCKCGKVIDERFDLCYDCDVKRKKVEETTETPFDRQKSIESQVAAKCTAQTLTGTDPTPETIGQMFVTYLELITGKGGE